MASYHLHGDASGETHITPIELPIRETSAGTVAGLPDIPTTTTGFGQFKGRKPDIGYHVAPRRQLIVVLDGELEIITTDGDSKRLQPGDLVLGDDIGSKGHISRDVGERPLMMMSVGIASEWELPQG